MAGRGGVEGLAVCFGETEVLRVVENIFDKFSLVLPRFGTNLGQDPQDAASSGGVPSAQFLGL